MLWMVSGNRRLRERTSSSCPAARCTILMIVIQIYPSWSVGSSTTTAATSGCPFLFFLLPLLKTGGGHMENLVKNDNDSAPIWSCFMGLLFMQRHQMNGRHSLIGLNAIGMSPSRPVKSFPLNSYKKNDKISCYRQDS